MFKLLKPVTTIGVGVGFRWIINVTHRNGDNKVSKWWKILVAKWGDVFKAHGGPSQGWSGHGQATNHWCINNILNLLICDRLQQSIIYESLKWPLILSLQSYHYRLVDQVQLVNRSSDWSCTRGMIQHKIHLNNPGCPRPSIALKMQNRGLKYLPFNCFRWKVRDSVVKQLMEGANRYSFVCNAVLMVCRCQNLEV